MCVQGRAAPTSDDGCPQHGAAGEPTLPHWRAPVLLPVRARGDGNRPALQPPVQPGPTQGGTVLQPVYTEERWVNNS